MKPNQDSDEKTISLQWAGLPIEYWIDLNISEGSCVCGILAELCGKFPEKPREFHILLISARLTHLAQINEIGFEFGTWDAATELPIDEGLTRLKVSQTWDEGPINEGDLAVFFKELSFRQRLLIVWSRIRGQPYTGRFSSLRRSANLWS